MSGLAVAYIGHFRLFHFLITFDNLAFNIFRVFFPARPVDSLVCFDFELWSWTYPIHTFGAPVLAMRWLHNISILYIVPTIALYGYRSEQRAELLKICKGKRCLCFVEGISNRNRPEFHYINGEKWIYSIQRSNLNILNKILLENIQRIKMQTTLFSFESSLFFWTKYHVWNDFSWSPFLLFRFFPLKFTGSGQKMLTAVAWKTQIITHRK